MKYPPDSQLVRTVFQRGKRSRELREYETCFIIINRNGWSYRIDKRGSTR